MAAYLKLVTLLFLISSLIFLSSVEARNSQFFSKEVRNPVAAKEDPKETPEATPATSTLDSETNNGYGLFGREGANNQEFTNDNNYYGKFGEDVKNQEFTNNNNYDNKFDEGVNNQELTNNNNYDNKFGQGVNNKELTNNNSYDNKFDEGVNNQEFTNNYDNKFGEGVNNQEFTNSNKFGEGVNNQEFTNSNKFDEGVNNQEFTNNKKYGEENQEFPAAEDTNSNELPSNGFFNNAEFTQRYDQNKDEETDEQTSRYGAGEVNRGYQQREPSNKYALKEYNNQQFNQQFRSNQGYPEESEHYGMSDTRLVENGKYFYDVKNKNHGSAYVSKIMPESGYYGSSLREYFNNYKPEEQPAGEYMP